MSQNLEERLTAALEARAGLVRLEDLTPLQVPEPARRSRPGPVMLLAVAATAAAAVAIPFLLRGAGESPGHGPSGTPSLTPTVTPTDPVTAANAKQADRQQADVDGDGSPDVVRLMLHTNGDGWNDAGYLEVRTASGVTRTATVPEGYLSGLMPATDINGDGRDQVMFTTSQGGESFSLRIYSWNAGELVPVAIRQGAAAPFATSETGPVTGYYIDDQGLFTFSAPDAHGKSRFDATLWKWSVDGAELVAAPAGQGCVAMPAPGDFRPCG